MTVENIPGFAHLYSNQMSQQQQHCTTQRMSDTYSLDAANNVNVGCVGRLSVHKEASGTVTLIINLTSHLETQLKLMAGLRFN